MAAAELSTKLYNIHTKIYSYKGHEKGYKNFTACSDPLQNPPAETSVSRKQYLSTTITDAPWENRLFPPGKIIPWSTIYSHGGKGQINPQDKLTSIDSPQHNSFRSATNFDSLP